MLSSNTAHRLNVAWQPLSAFNTYITFPEVFICCFNISEPFRLFMTVPRGTAAPQRSPDRPRFEVHILRGSDAQGTRTSYRAVGVQGGGPLPTLRGRVSDATVTFWHNLHVDAHSLSINSVAGRRRQGGQLF